MDADDTGGVSPERIVALLRSRSRAPLEVAAGDVTLDFCARLASEAAATLRASGSQARHPLPPEAQDAAQTISELLNDIMSTAATAFATSPKPFTSADIIAWLLTPDLAPPRPQASSALEVAATRPLPTPAPPAPAAPLAPTTGGAVGLSLTSARGWNVGAAEFVPGSGTKATPTPTSGAPGGARTGPPTAAAAAAAAAGVDTGPRGFEHAHAAVHAHSGWEWQHHPHGEDAAWWQQQQQQPDDPSGWAAPGAFSEDAAGDEGSATGWDAAGSPVDLLVSLFPHYSHALLVQLLDARQQDLAAAVEELLLLDALPAIAAPPERGTTAVGATGAPAWQQARHQRPLPAGVRLQDSAAFPSLPTSQQATHTGRAVTVHAVDAPAGTSTQQPPLQDPAVEGQAGPGLQPGGAETSANGSARKGGGKQGGRARGRAGTMSLGELLAGLPSTTPAPPSSSSAAAATTHSTAAGAAPTSWAAKAAAQLQTPPRHPQQQQQAAAAPGAKAPGAGGRPAPAPAAPGATGWQGVPRVATGEALSAQYGAARQEASDWARARNKCFQEATRAYLAGNKALAKELSARGKAYAANMWAAHEQAAQSLMDQRGAVRAAPGGPVVLDLHGLHIREALTVLQQQLSTSSSAASGSSAGVLHVVTGVGKHSKTAGSVAHGRLLSAIEEELESLGYAYTQPQPGLLVVRLH